MNPSPATRRVIPIRPLPTTTLAAERRQQRWRLAAQMAFFVLFVLTPVFDLLRFDLTRGHAYFLGMEWKIGLEAYLDGRLGSGELALNLLLRLFLPLVAAAALLVGVAWRWGRLYCGWLCPHFSVVETINALMKRATGKPSVWEAKPLPTRQADGSREVRQRRAGFAAVALAVAFAAAWAVVLLSYLMPPLEMYGRLARFSPLPGETIFLVAATAVFSLEFLLARHLFCQYACAVGLFQSLAWMSNRRARVVGVDRARLAECADCLGGEGAACEAACPMRLKPRAIKRLIFACTQCAQCVTACATVKRDDRHGSLLAWVDGAEAERREAGFKAPRADAAIAHSGRPVPPAAASDGGARGGQANPRRPFLSLGEP